MHHRIVIASLVGALAIAVLIAGCGGGGGDSTSTNSSTETEGLSPTSSGLARGDEEAKPPGTTKAAPANPVPKAIWVKRANIVCRHTNEKISKEIKHLVEENVGSEGFDLHTAEVELVPTLLIPQLITELEELRALGVPTEGADQVDPIVDETREMIAKLEEEPEAIHSDLFGTVSARAEGLGIDRCPVG